LKLGGHPYPSKFVSVRTCEYRNLSTGSSRLRYKLIHHNLITAYLSLRYPQPPTSANWSTYPEWGGNMRHDTSFDDVTHGCRPFVGNRPGRLRRNTSDQLSRDRSRCEFCWIEKACQEAGIRQLARLIGRSEEYALLAPHEICDEKRVSPKILLLTSHPEVVGRAGLITVLEWPRRTKLIRAQGLANRTRGPIHIYFHALGVDGKPMIPLLGLCVPDTKVEIRLQMTTDGSLELSGGTFRFVRLRTCLVRPRD
jgi:hypothetical protein